MTAKKHVMDITHIWGSPEADEVRHLEKVEVAERKAALKRRRQRAKRREETFDAARTDVINRRRLVAKSVARGLSNEEIRLLLNEEGVMLTHDKKVPLSVVQRDRQLIKREWQAETGESAELYKQKHLQELAELKRQAWKREDFAFVMKVIEKEMDIVRVKQDTAPTNAGTVNVKNEYTQVNLLSQVDRDERLIELLDTARERRADVLDEDGAYLEAAPSTKDSV